MEPLTIRQPGFHPVPDRPDLRSTYRWNPGMPKDVVLRVSKSSLVQFAFCEMQYFIKYVLGVKEPANDNMTRGTNVHDAVEDFYDALDLSVAQEARGKGRDHVRSLFLSHIPDHSKHKEFRGVVTPSAPFTLNEQDHLIRYMETEVGRFMVSDPEDFMPVINEGSFNAVMEIEVGDVMVPIHLTGIMDRVFKAPNGALHVHELKTGVWKDKKTKWESMRQEMAFYVMLMHKAEGKEITHWGWDHTGCEPHTFRHVEPVQVSAILGMREKLRSLVRAHMGYLGGAEGPFHTLSLGAESFICEPYCAVKGYCPKYGRVLMPQDMLPKMNEEE